MRSRTRAFVWLPALLVLSACEDPASGPAAPPAFDAVAEATEGMVVSGSPYATEAGVRMLEKGGNAVDAAVAAAFVLAVAEPTQSGLGGRTQLLFRRADGLTQGIDGGTEVPADYDPGRAPTGETGRSAVGIPGTVAALTRLLAEHGSLPLADVLRPAVEWAREGIVLPEGEEERIRRLVEEEGPGSDVAELFALEAGGSPAPVDIASARRDPPTSEGSGRATLIQPALARTLRAVSEDGRAGFYEGAVAARMAEDLASGGGFVSESDLAGYRALDAPVGRARVGDFEIVGTYLPASGVTVAQILSVLDRSDLPPDEAGWAELVVGALLAGFEDRETAEEMEPGVAIAWLTSDSLAERRAAEIARGSGGGSASGGRSADTEAVTGAAGAPNATDALEPPFTTHVSVADGEGNVVALTQSLGPSGGARVVTPDLGFLYASTLGGYLTAGGPGYRPWSSQAPVVVLREGEPVFVMGGAGARRIISALVTTLSRILHRGETLRQAMGAPRLHPTGGRILVEDGWDVAVALKAGGYDVEPRERSYFARLNVIGLGGDAMVGIAQPGWSGASAGGPARE